ncbi:MAG: tripartite tricarboxylate transporter permease [Mycobacterium sp.]
MDLLTHILTGFGDAFTPTNLLYCFIGVIMGTLVGILPGLGPATAIALLLPLTLGLDPLPALIMLAGIYYGSMHGGIITAVLIATPGESSAVVTVLDGHTLARMGRAGPVLAMSALASFLAGTLTIPFVMIFVSVLGTFSLRFGPPEISVIILLGLVGVVGFVGKNRFKGFAMAAAGLLIAAVGLDTGTGIPRFTFGITEMFGGVDFLYAVIGLFALGEVLHSIGVGQPNPIRTRLREMIITRDDWRHSRMPILRGGFLGLFLGMMPGAGATVSSFLSYDMERRIGARKGRVLGTGVIEGVCGPQAADNAAVNGSFVPTLSLGIPGSAATAIVLGGMLLHGIQPGPLLMTTEPRLVWGLLASFYIGNLMLVLINVPLAPLFASILRVKYAFLYPAVVVLCFIGAFSVDNHMTGVWLAFIFGIVGWFAVRYDYPLAPMILGIILGGPFERSIVQSAEIGRGSMAIYLDHPIALTLLAIVAAMVILPPVISRLRRSAGKPPITDLSAPLESLAAQKPMPEATLADVDATEAHEPGADINDAPSNPTATSRGDTEKGERAPLIAKGRSGKN